VYGKAYTIKSEITLKKGEKNDF
jgi:hypothetical protein